MLLLSFVLELGGKQKIRVEGNGGRMQEGTENFNVENYPIWAKFKPRYSIAANNGAIAR